MGGKATKDKVVEIKPGASEEAKDVSGEKASEEDQALKDGQTIPPEQVPQATPVVEFSGAAAADTAADEKEEYEGRNSLLVTEQIKKKESKRAGALKEQLTIGFIDETSGVQTAIFTKAPLGFSFNQHKTPPLVSGVRERSVAYNEGIEVGWTVAEINGKSVKEMVGKAAAELIEDLLKNGLVEVCASFSDDGVPRTAIFTERPLGIAFRRIEGVGFTVTGVKKGSSGMRSGVKIGWTLTKVGDKDIVDMEDEKFQDVLAEMTKTLPIEDQKAPKDIS